MLNFIYGVAFSVVVWAVVYLVEKAINGGEYRSKVTQDTLMLELTKMLETGDYITGAMMKDLYLIKVKHPKVTYIYNARIGMYVTLTLRDVDIKAIVVKSGDLNIKQYQQIGEELAEWANHSRVITTSKLKEM